jgi:hypothetical protein
LQRSSRLTQRLTRKLTTEAWLATHLLPERVLELLQAHGGLIQSNLAVSGRE